MAKISTDGVSPSHYGDLNEQYYSRPVGNYLRTRLGLLLAVADESSAIGDIWSHGLHFGEVSFGFVPPGEEAASHHPVVDTDEFVTLETLALAQLSSETLIRQFAAHESTPPCPWLELATLTSPREIKQVADSILAMEAGALARRARPVFRGTADRPPDSTQTKEAWDEDGEALARLLSYAADRVANGAQANNSLKHGLAVFGSRPSLTLGTPDSATGVILDLSGPAYSYVAWERQESGMPLWKQHTTFLATEQTIGLIATVIQQLDAMWAIARARYLRDLSGKYLTLGRAQLEKLIDLPTGTQLTGLRGMTMTHTFAQVRD